MKDENIKKGIAWLLFSAFGFSMMGMFVKAAGDIPFIQKTLFRNSVAFIIAFTTLIIHARKDKSILHIEKRAYLWLFLRCVIGVTGIFGNFYAIGKLKLGDAAMLQKMSPFFAVLGAMIFLGEKPTVFSVGSLIAAFFGSLFVIKPSMELSAFFPAIIGFIGGIGAGFAATFVRKLHSYNVSGYVIITTFSLFSTILAVPFTVLNYTPMTTNQLLCLIGTGVGGACGQFGLTGAYFNASARKISVYDYSMVIFSAILGFIIFGQIPDFYSFIGYTIIITTAVIVYIVNLRKDTVSKVKQAES